MDREPQELQHMGLFGIYREAYKITLSWRKIFSQITLSLIFPLSFMCLAQFPISKFFISQINKSQAATPSEFIALYIFGIFCFLFFLILFLISTSAVVYTMASIYSSKEVTFKKVMSVVPKVWKRLMITFLWNFLIMFLFYLLAILLIFLFAMVLAALLATGTIRPEALITYYIVYFIILFIPYVIGVMYISVIWHVANIISVLEETYGLEAMKKSKNLIKGKIRIATAIFVNLQILVSVILMVFNYLVVYGESIIGMVGRVSLGILCFLLLTILIHFFLVILTIFYFVCKSYHNENIDKSYLAGHLDVYHQGVYVPLISDQNV